MTISQALSNANSGLAVTGRRASVTANNISNALTEGYSRRDVMLSERTTLGAGGGVTVAGVARASNPALTLERRGADAEFARNDAEASALARISNLLGAPEDPNALFEKYARLDASFRALANAPDSATAQQSSVTAAADLANSFNKISSAYQQIRLEADTEIAQRIATVNTVLQQIDKLNSAIQSASVTNGDTAGLIDQRQRLIDQVNESIPVRELQRDNGVVELMTHQGVFLVAGQARTIQFTQTPVITDQSTYNGGAGVLSGLTVDGINITPGGPGAQGVTDGAIAGLFAVRDQIVPEMSLALDALAFELVERFSDPALDPTLAPGAPGIFTDAGAPADPLMLIGVAGRIAINAVIDSTAGGEARRVRDGLGSLVPGPAGSDVFVRALIDTMSISRTPPAGLQSGRDLGAAEGAAHLTSLAGAARATANLRLGSAQILAERLSDAEKLETGVDIDRELQKILEIEQAYAANARVIQAVDEMIERLFEAIR